MVLESTSAFNRRGGAILPARDGCYSRRWAEALWGSRFTEDGGRRRVESDLPWGWIAGAKPMTGRGKWIGGAGRRRPRLP